MKDFTKADLKNRMAVEVRDGEKYIVVDDVLLGNNSFAELGYYNDDLTHYEHHENDIIKVYPAVVYYFSDIDTIEHWRAPIWERSEVKEVTMAEVEEKFGCKVKIVDG
jgi:hypothetical protein